MSTTRTTTQYLQTYMGSLTLELSLLDKVKDLISQLKEKGVLPADFLDKWLESFQQKHLNRDGSLALAFLLDAIEDQIGVATDEDKLELLSSVHEGLESLLEESLPEGVSLDDFIREYERLKEKEKTQAAANAAIEEIRTFFRGQRAQLVMQANQSRDNLQRVFLSLKERIRQEYLSRGESSTSAVQAINTVGRSVFEELALVIGEIEKIQEQDKAVEGHKEKLLTTLEQLDSTLQQIKRI